MTDIVGDRKVRINVERCLRLPHRRLRTAPYQTISFFTADLTTDLDTSWQHRYPLVGKHSGVSGVMIDQSGGIKNRTGASQD